MPDSLHASAVAINGRAVLLTGPSGSGKSSLALSLMAIGATLVSDDRVVVEPCEGRLWLSAPDQLRGKVEARGLGILNVPWTTAQAVLVVDMSSVETERLPEWKSIQIAGIALPSIRKVESPTFAAMLLIYLSEGSTE